MATEHQSGRGRTKFEGVAAFVGDTLELLAIPALVALAVVAVIGIPDSTPAVVAATLGPFLAAAVLTVVARLATSRLDA